MSGCRCNPATTVSLICPPASCAMVLLRTVTEHAGQFFSIVAENASCPSLSTAKSLIVSTSTCASPPESAITQLAIISLHWVLAPAAVCPITVSSYSIGPMKFPTIFTPAALYSGTTPCHTACRSEEHTSELQSRQYLVCRLLLEKKI